MTAEKGNIMAQALNLTDLTAYQEGSVVSRTLIDKKVGTITVFAFAEGEGLSEHTAPFDAFVQVIEGQRRSPLPEWSMPYMPAR